ncbi:MAG TPA: sulfite exporter TauE/SafE family protein [Pyrinomonadaceae bacterium]|jgi:ABC-type nickel/cobalt efflux system permease component RcnA
MTDATLITVLGLGLVLGLRHALDPDHLAAVSTIVSESKSLRRSSLVGTFWGLGHTLALLLAGMLVIALKFQISARLTVWMEFVVALMLILLGIKSLLRSARGLKVHIHRHRHDGTEHVHVHLHRPGEQHAHQHRHLIRFGARPFLIGMVHGMAGSGALMILVLATIPSAVAALVYIAIFGLGSIGGMLLMSVVISLPFVLTGKRFSIFGQALHVMVGLFSLAFGLFLVWQYGVRDGLLF